VVTQDKSTALIVHKSTLGRPHAESGHTFSAEEMREFTRTLPLDSLQCNLQPDRRSSARRPHAENGHINKRRRTRSEIKRGDEAAAELIKKANSKPNRHNEPKSTPTHTADARGKKRKGPPGDTVDQGGASVNPTSGRTESESDGIDIRAMEKLHELLMTHQQTGQTGLDLMIQETLPKILQKELNIFQKRITKKDRFVEVLKEQTKTKNLIKSVEAEIKAQASKPYDDKSMKKNMEKMNTSLTKLLQKDLTLNNASIKDIAAALAKSVSVYNDTEMHSKMDEILAKEPENLLEKIHALRTDITSNHTQSNATMDTLQSQMKDMSTASSEGTSTIQSLTELCSSLEKEVISQKDKRTQLNLFRELQEKIEKSMADQHALMLVENKKLSSKLEQSIVNTQISNLKTDLTTLITTQESKKC
jgi:hypothetical protein